MPESFFADEKPPSAHRMLEVLFRPRQVFEILKTHHRALDWLLPLAIVSCVSVIAGQLTFPIMMAEQQAAIERNETLTEEQREQMLQSQEAWIEGAGRWSLIALAPVSIALTVLIQAAVFGLATKLAVGMSVRYAKVFVVICHSTLVGAVATAVRVPLILAKGTMKVHTGLGALFGQNATGSPLYALLSQVDVFVLWQLVLVTVGIAVLYGTTTKRAAVVVFALWGLWVMASVAVNSLLFGA